MPFDWTITDWTANWTTADRWFWTIAAVVAVAVVIWSVRAMVQASLDTRFEIFVGVVQAGMAWTMIHGTYEYFRHVVDMPTHESWLTSAVIESVMWVGAGMIVLHGRQDGTTGWGYGGPVFIAAGAGGAVLAVLASEDWRQAVGRIVIVVLGMYTLVARLLKATRRADVDAPPSRWSLRYWRARRTHHNPREWETRVIARAIRRSNSGFVPLRWTGGWTLTRRAEAVLPQVLAEARRRAALARAIRKNVAWTSAVMVQMIEDANAWTMTAETVRTLPGGPDADGPDQSMVHALDHGLDHRSTGLDHAPLDHAGPSRTGPRSTRTDRPRTIRGELAAAGPSTRLDPDRLAAKIALIKAHVGDDWPDIMIF